MSTIELEEEVGRLKNYLALEQLRMEHRFNFTISVDNSIDDEALIPSMILQPIVENAIWHGLSNIDSDGLIVIQFIQLEENIVKIIIEDNGIGIKKASSQPNQKPAHLKIGSELTRKRLAILGKKMNVKTNISISEAFPGNPRPGTRVEIVAPISYKIIEIE
jgi:LytS/YehU family sensor histidine kinase